MWTHNLDPDFRKSFEENFASINPWNTNWSTMKSGDLLLSEDMAPARLFRKSAFYEEWLRPQGRFDAGAGLLLRHGETDRLFLTVHYDPGVHDEYGPALARIYTGIRGHLDRAASLAEQFAVNNKAALSEAALVGHGGDCAIVIDQHMQLESANEIAISMLSKRGFLTGIDGRIQVGSSADSASIRRALESICRGNAIDDSRFYISSVEGPWLVKLFALPAVAASFASIIPSRQLFLLLARHLASAPSGLTGDAFARAYSLTAAELIFCDKLAEGLTIEGAAELLGIARDTARQRLKSIFRKTDTNRQSQLIALLLRAR
jgi:DNA-binding CsgD family transcriptional regulator